jgi:gliding motility-associated-like protein
VNETLSSFSNTICLEQGPRIYVPNAIVPNGTNAIFKPVIIYGSAEGYSMKIFNRYGEVIFETDDINDGWTGVYNNKTVELGTYGYLITFSATNGQVINKKGNVTVVR